MKNYDVVIFGAGLSGLVTAYTLSSFGIKCCLLEKNDMIGGGNTSFKNDLGDIFDSGYHALDESRSMITSNLFKKAVPDYISHQLRRGVILDNNIIEYNSDLSSWPSSLQEKFKLASVDDISGDITEEKLSKVYGSDFIDFCNTNVFQSYPSEVRSQKEGRSLLRMYDQIYPWFFPKLSKTDSGLSESENYHNKMRSTSQSVIYPNHSGFFGFIQGLFDLIDKEYCDVFLGCKDIDIILDDNFQCTGVHAAGESFYSNHYFWCAPFFGLASLYNIPFPKGVPQKLALGSFRVDYELSDRFHEILVGDNQHLINRISFPGLLSNIENNLIQVEFIFPSDEYDDDIIFWKKHWIDSLIKLEIFKNRDVLDFNFNIQNKGMVTADPLDEISDKFKNKISDVAGNIFTPFLNAGPENINRLVPSVIKNTISYITKEGIL